MPDDPFSWTSEKWAKERAKWEAELAYLRVVRLPAVTEWVRALKELGDTPDNRELREARMEEDSIEYHIRILEEAIDYYRLFAHGLVERPEERAASGEGARSIEDDFRASWNEVEASYPLILSRREHEPGHLLADLVIAFIREMRQAGYDAKLRAGISLWWLLLSRSRRHGLRYFQPYLHFHFGRGVTVFFYRYGESQYVPRPEVTLPEIEFTPEVDRLLQQLAAHEID